ncbi:MAG: F-box protein [Methylomonas sp.]|jgi:hypothetical protein|uniref:F-box protein n=1 Tax=Methylomonas sp. TaxID=418 RepID=UPI0025FC7C66|nr:F-box protein [Methylomonas sp.]MCK9607805.1 F-box protein [Methylomonas sp.]
MEIIDDYPLTLIFENLDTRELLRCSKVSRTIRRIIDAILDSRSKRLIAIAQGDDADYRDWQNIGRYALPQDIRVISKFEYEYAILRGAYKARRDDIVELFFTTLFMQNYNRPDKSFSRIARYAFIAGNAFLIEKVLSLSASNPICKSLAQYRLAYHLAKHGFSESAAQKIYARIYSSSCSNGKVRAKATCQREFCEGRCAGGYFPPTKKWKRAFRGICRIGNITWAKKLIEAHPKVIRNIGAFGKSGNIEFAEWILVSRIQIMRKSGNVLSMRCENIELNL